MIISKQTNLYKRIAHCFLYSVLVFAVFFSMSASAYNWSNDYTVTASVARNDNFRLTEDDPIATTSTDLGVGGELRGADEVSNIRIGGSIKTTTYSDSSIEDSEDYGLILVAKRKGERWFGTFDLIYSLRPLTETELLDTGIRVDGSKESTSIAPGISYQLDERNSIYSNFVASDVSYDTVLLTGYSDNTIAIGWVNQFSEISNVSINTSVSEYNPDDNDTTIITSFYIGYSFDTSELTRYDLRLGTSVRDEPIGTERNGNSSLAITHIADNRNAFSLFAGNGYVGSGAGEVRYQSELSLAWDHSLTEKMQFNLTVDAIKSEERDYFDIVAGGNYKLTRNLKIAANYGYRSQHGDIGNADSNSVMFSLRYSPDADFDHGLRN